MLTIIDLFIGVLFFFFIILTDPYFEYMQLVFFKFVLRYFAQLKVAFHELPSLIGFFIFLVLCNQLISGIMLSFSLIPEAMYIPLSREEEDSENLYTDDFFFLHERGVDLLVIFIFAHLFRKMHVFSMTLEQENAWKSGVLMYLLLQVVIFLGLVLCCTHLSEITLTIASNAFQSFCFYIGKLSYPLFTDQNLNTDTLVRLAYLHYILGFLLTYLGIYHGIDMHYDWKAEEAATQISQELLWFDEGLVNELGQILNVLKIFGILSLYLFIEPEALHYELFMWGDIGMSTDIRFLGVAPHWYFRPYMHWLIACPFHYTGLLGIILFFVSFYYQPNIIGSGEFRGFSGAKNIYNIFFTSIWKDACNKRISELDMPVVEIDTFYRITYTVFIVALWYIFSYLPFGKFYNSIGGNTSSLLAFIYIFFYLSSPYLRIPRHFKLSKLILN